MGNITISGGDWSEAWSCDLASNETLKHLYMSMSCITRSNRPTCKHASTKRRQDSACLSTGASSDTISHPWRADRRALCNHDFSSCSPCGSCDEDDLEMGKEMDNAFGHDCATFARGVSVRIHFAQRLLRRQALCWLRCRAGFAR